MITLTVITTCFSEYKYSEVLYSSGSASASTGQRTRYSAANKGSGHSISSNYRLKKTAKMRTVLAELKIKFSQQQNCGKIDCQVQLTSTHLKCELLEIVRQILRF